MNNPFPKLNIFNITRSTPVGTDELWARTRFAAVAAAVKERKGDPKAALFLWLLTDVG